MDLSRLGRQINAVLVIYADLARGTSGDLSDARDLLATSDRQITSVCYDVGYDNVANFNRRFLERKHVTPREYRRQARKRLTRGFAEKSTD